MELHCVLRSVPIYVTLMYVANGNISLLYSMVMHLTVNGTYDPCACSCGDEALIQLLRMTSSNIEKVVAKLVDTAELLADMRTEPELGEYQRATERAEILRRDWGAKVCVRCACEVCV